MSKSADQVKRLLAQYHALSERRFKGDADAICILLDLNDAIKRADLTTRQHEALHYVYIEDLKQKDAGNRMGVTPQAVGLYAENAIQKITRVYEEVFGVVDSNDIFGRV